MPWDPQTIDAQVVAIHAALVRTANGQPAIVYFGGYFNESVSHVYEVIGGTVGPPLTDTPGSYIFCCGHALQGDGRWIVAGGVVTQNISGPHLHAGHDSGEQRAYLFSPLKGTWLQIANLNFQPDGSMTGGGRWYPTVVPLSSGHVIAIGGHPHDTDTYGSPERHNNTIPERYFPSLDEWVLLQNETTAENAAIFEYPRVHTLPNGVLFFSTPTKGANRYYNPYTGAFEGNAINPLDDTRYHDGNEGTQSVLLPLLPDDNQHHLVLVCGSTNSARVNVATGSAWTHTPRGTWPNFPQGSGPVRQHGCAVLLPTGQVFVTGGVTPPQQNAAPGTPNTPVKRYEIYSPAIDWNTGKYTNGNGAWATGVADDAAQVARGYHSTALLMPDGCVWTAGSTDSGSLETSGVGSVAAGSTTLTLTQGQLQAFNEGHFVIIPGAADDPNDPNTPVPLLSEIVNVVSSTEATLQDPAANAVNGITVWWGPFRETRIEVFRPQYVNAGGRPVIDHCQASVGYTHDFDVALASAAPIGRVALLRCGSVTHAFDPDQRYVGLKYTQAGSVLHVTAPTSPELAPPGNYMLWVLNTASNAWGIPCEEASIIRVCSQDAYFALELSTYSLLAVKALKKPYTKADVSTFAGAIQLFFEGYLPHELGLPGQTPDISWEFSNGDATSGMHIELSKAADEIDPVAIPDISQKFTFLYDVIFDNEDDFATFGEDESRKVIVRAELEGHRASVDLTLMKKANPFMKDGDPPYLSPDLRILKAAAADVEAAGSPEMFLQDTLEAFNNSPIPDEADNHPFSLLSTSQTENPIVLEVPTPGEGTYNFAIARVRYLSIPNENATGVKVFFRLFNTVGTALEYDKDRAYKLLNSAAATIPGLGKVAFYLTAMPFFGEPRVTPSVEMNEQSDNAVNRKTLFGKGPEMEFVYFGCWLDVNTREKHFPRFPDDDGPFDDMVFEPLVEMVQLITGYHQCLVAEIFYADDPTERGDTPFTSDNLAQRNLASVWVANPGVEITRTAQTTFEVKPSEIPPQALGAPPLISAPPGFVGHARNRPDELLFWRNNLPAETTVTLYLPDVDIDEILALRTQRLAPPILERVDSHTVRFQLGEVTYVPLPGGRTTTIPGLMSVELPAGIQKGKVYTLTVRQYSGRTLRFVGAFQLSIPVGDKASLLPAEVKKLSLLRHVAEAMPPKDRWYPIFARYLGEIGDRVRGFGGDPDRVQPSPHGSGTRDYEPSPPPRPQPCGAPVRPGKRIEGKISRLLYDCFGDFEGFIVDCCGGEHRFRSCGKSIEETIDRACKSGRRVTITALANDPHRPYRVEIHCC